MASRKYRRDSKGRFAGSAGGGGGTFVTTGKAGGFANQAFRARVAAGSPSSGKGTATRLAKGKKGAFPLGTRRRKVAKTVVGLTVGNPLAVSMAVGAVMARSRGSNKEVSKGLSLVNRNASLYGQNARSTTNIIRRSRGRI